MKAIRKYLIPFAITLLLFGFSGFYPTDCLSAKGEGGGCAAGGLTDKVSDSCTWKGIPLHGKVKFVESFADIKIEFVESFPDLNVKFVESFPEQCGQWKIVESFPDFTVKVVESFPDIRVKVVNSFPGKP